MDERTYTDDEVRQILTAATEPLPSSSKLEGEDVDMSVGNVRRRTAPPQGFTLSELREIGVEAGIDPERIALAAFELNVPPEETVLERDVVGLPRRMSRKIPLSSPFQGEGWERVVVLLRERFGGPGELSTEGSLQTWRHENVSVLQEPDPVGPGWRLRVEVEPGDAGEWLDIAGMLSLVGLIGVPVGLFTDARDILALIGAILLVVSAAGAAWLAVVTLPRWNRRTESELKTLAREVTALEARHSEVDAGTLNRPRAHIPPRPEAEG
ncbi:MAG: hypothetical protein EA422_06380 [Gemmatimonadales bacterium]|nr:MAG: hypothetical protein EA422_06380 [Gemmatimonadales bacterium]